MKTPEEKAREYAMDCTICPTLESQEEIDQSHQEEIERAYLKGYHSRDEEVKELREALKECISKMKVCRDLIGYEAENTIDLTVTIVKAKQLLNNEQKGIDLAELEKRLDDSLDNETKESLTEWITKQRLKEN
ncbi:hypothetical protein JGH11_16995 [Dysgonomonas sp. Marseille-P4677]|uniref:hypothetical protein n=1 Tax=Dysgonomonas sp. Marseille-P4677 TaxID=2364790 RepID=UPI0019122205|nr:hypothetical protein [Dysgonomonas sp. Marseille-P4677]MBK5722573.1 hypothetical protein [Dysgonomonas sp. Marseille-P4677]